MVNIVGLTNEERALKAKTSRLVEITEQIVGKQRVVLSIGNILIRHSSTEAPDFPISIAPYLNQVSVDFRSYFEEAIRLAEAYEKETGNDFTVKKRYEG